MPTIQLDPQQAEENCQRNQQESLDVSEGNERSGQTVFNPFIEQFFLLLFPLLEEIENVMEFLFDGQI